MPIVESSRGSFRVPRPPTSGADLDRMIEAGDAVPVPPSAPQPTLTPPIRVGEPSGPPPQITAEAVAPLLPPLVRAGTAMLGGGLGLATGGPFGSLAGTMLGAAAGEPLVNLLGAARGESIPSPPQTLRRMAEAAAAAGGMEALLGPLSPVGRAAAAALARLPAPVAALASQLGIPLRAGDITPGRPIQALENVPTFFAIGSGPTQRFAERQMLAAEHAAQRMVPAPVTQFDAGVAAQQSIRALARAWKSDARQGFQSITQLAGDAPVVPTTNLQRTLTELFEEATPVIPLPPAARRLATKFDMQGAVTIGTTPVDVSRLPEPLREALRAVQRIGEPISFQAARRLEVDLGDLAYGAGREGVQRGRLRSLYRAVRTDLDDFLATRGDVSPALDLAKREYQEKKHLFDERMRALVTGKRTSPSAVVHNVFSGAIENVIDFRKAAPPDVYHQATTAWLSDLLQRSYVPRAGAGAGIEAFSPAKFNALMHPYLRDHRLDAILEPEAAETVRQLMTIFGRLGRAERLAGAGQQAIAGGLLTTGQLRAILTGALGVAGYGGGGAAGAAISAGMPWAISKFTTSEPGITMLSRGLSRYYPDTTVRMAAQIIGQGIPELLEPAR